MRTSYLTPRKLDALNRSLSDRERSVLWTLSIVRVATALQLQRLHFGDVGSRERRRVLHQLATKQLLYRLPRQVGGVRAGSSGFVYAAGLAAQRLSQTGRPQQPWVPSLTFLRHQLSVTEIYVGLVERQRQRQCEIRLFQGEPQAWRYSTGVGGAGVWLKPDAYLVLQLGEHIDHWFLELDCDTESPRTLSRKLDAYWTHFKSGKEQQQVGVFPKVMFIVPDKRRYDTLVEVFAKAPPEAWPLFGVCLMDEAVDRLLEGVTT